MKKIWKLIVVCLALAAIVGTVSLIADRKALQEDLIRLHVVANSDSQKDQELKLQVRDEVLRYLQDAMEKLPDAQEAKSFLAKHLQELENHIDGFLKGKGSDYSVCVSLGKEMFDIREYDTFSLPSGVYESLRITIGQGQGRNWWCVVFPRLCLPAVSSSFEDTAAGAGFSKSLVPTLQQEKGYEVRFFLLDVLGRIENFFFHK